MIETPRAALCAAEIARYADFLSVGSNDLTQFMLATSRDDGRAGFLEPYLQDGLLPDDPFVRLDRQGVGRLLDLCVAAVRAERPDLPIAVCGEHAGDPDSLADLAALDLSYVSCSPGRVPLARFALGRLAVIA
jgi:pyruvate,orthophosphate dikinase